jgi:hypothetical protein
MGNLPYGMSAQVPFRGSAAAAAFLAPLGPTANLFSTITLPEPPFRAEPDSGGSNGNHVDEEEKTLAVQEKNRRAQKRFRERQKAKMKDMTEQLDEMSGELGKLRVENNSLKNRNNILEKVLTLRDEHIRVLQDEQQVFDLGSQYLQHGAGGGGGGGGQKLLTGGAGSAITVVGDEVLTDVAAIKAMPADAVINHWKETVRELGNILVQIEELPDKGDARHQEGMAALCRVLDAAGQLCMHTAVLHPTNMQRLIAATLDDGRSGISAEDRGRWATVTASLQLTPDQKVQVVSLRAIFLRRMAKVMDDRRVVLAKLQAVSIPDRMVALQSVISETLKVNEATVALKANLQEEHLAGMEFIGTVFKTIFSPLQKARAIVQSYPFYPDVYQIATTLATPQPGAAMPLPEALALTHASGASGSAALYRGGSVGMPADHAPLLGVPIPFSG